MPTGHGANDANGVYLYGELDATGPLFSDFLNLAPASISARLAIIFGRDIVTYSTPTAISNSVFTDLFYDTTVMATCAGIAPNLVTGEFVCSIAGTYRFEAVVEFAANATGVRSIQTNKAVSASPTAYTLRRQGVAASGSASQAQNASVVDNIALAVGDRVKLTIRQASGSSLNVTFASVTVQQIA